ncbi:Hypothetical_protein [Hexamita inflata]|uniref:Hypothetical_protein n=1 Tax=Hexamita inflata TaxID=28002 RepID=A0AA86QGX1_9EUKA|nr:Hypothetical protein HINF_LOCUS39085 [Hexamita inflata]
MYLTPVTVVSGFKSRTEVFLQAPGCKIPIDKSYCQILQGDKSTTLYCDIDDQNINIIEQLQKLVSKFGSDKQFYVLKSNKFNKYHVFCEQIIFENLSEMKRTLNSVSGLMHDQAVYSSTSQLFRLIGQSKNFNLEKGIYNQMYRFVDNQLELYPNAPIYLYIIHQNYKPTYINAVASEAETPVHELIHYCEGSESHEYEDSNQDSNQDFEQNLNLNINIETLRRRCVRESMNSESGTYDQRRRFAYFIYNLTLKNKQETIKIIKQFVEEGIFKQTFGNIGFEQFINNFK